MDAFFLNMLMKQKTGLVGPFGDYLPAFFYDKNINKNKNQKHVPNYMCSYAVMVIKLGEAEFIFSSIPLSASYKGERIDIENKDWVYETFNRNDFRNLKLVKYWKQFKTSALASIPKPNKKRIERLSTRLRKEMETTKDSDASKTLWDIDKLFQDEDPSVRELGKNLLLEYADMGVSSAKEALAINYLEGTNGFDRDEKKALSMLDDIAVANPRIYAFISSAYAGNFGVKKNKEKAKYYLKKYVDASHPESAHALASYYLDKPRSMERMMECVDYNLMGETENPGNQLAFKQCNGILNSIANKPKRDRAIKEKLLEIIKKWTAKKVGLADYLLYRCYKEGLLLDKDLDQAHISLILARIHGLKIKGVRYSHLFKELKTL